MAIVEPDNVVMEDGDLVTAHVMETETENTYAGIKIGGFRIWTRQGKPGAREDLDRLLSAVQRALFLMEKCSNP